jgi:hypothetical protein
MMRPANTTLDERNTEMGRQVRPNNSFRCELDQK